MPQYSKQPVTLDEVLRRIARRLRGGGQGGPGKPRSWRTGGVLAVVLGLALAWMAFGVSSVADGEQGVVIVLGHVVAKVNPGLHWHPPYPLGRIVAVDTTTERRSQFEGRLFTRDGQLVDVALTMAYRIEEPGTFLFASAAPEVLLDKAIQSTAMDAVAARSLDDLHEVPQIELRQQLTDRLRQDTDLQQTGLGVLRVVDMRLGVPKEVMPAYDKAVAAQVAVQRQVDEARTSYASQVMSQAQGKANELLQEASRHHARQLATARQRLALFEALLPAYDKAPEALLRWLGAQGMRPLATNGTVVVDASGRAMVSVMVPDPAPPREGAATEQTEQPAEAIRPLPLPPRQPAARVGNAP